MKKLLVMIMLLLILISTTACSETVDGAKTTTLSSARVVEVYSGGRLVTTQVYDTASEITTIYTYNYTYDKTLFCSSTNVMIVDKGGTVISHYTSNTPEVLDGN